MANIALDRVVRLGWNKVRRQFEFETLNIRLLDWNEGHIEFTESTATRGILPTVYSDLKVRNWRSLHYELFTILLLGPSQRSVHLCCKGNFCNKRTKVNCENGQPGANFQLWNFQASPTSLQSSWSYSSATSPRDRRAHSTTQLVDLQKVKKRMEHHQEEPWQQYQKNLWRTKIFHKLPQKNSHLMEHTE